MVAIYDTVVCLADRDSDELRRSRHDVRPLAEPEPETYAGTVLIVDDDNTLRTTLKKIFAKAGYRTQTAKSGQEALELFAAEKPDIVLADLKMPGKDGISLLAEMREQRAECKVIIMTAYGDQDSRSDALRLGAFAYLNQPVSRAELLALCGKALGGS